jgi:hypothetical protein
MLIGIWKLLFGYVKIKIEGLSIDKLVNRALAEGIELRGLRRIGYARLEAEMFARDHRRFLSLSREYPVKVELRSATGCPTCVIKALGRLDCWRGLRIGRDLAAMSRFNWWWTSSAPTIRGSSWSCGKRWRAGDLRRRFRGGSG